MSRVLKGSVCKLCRREGGKLFLKGDRCFKEKCSFTVRPYAPGQHGFISQRKRPSEFAVRLREKQKARRMYGISERQFVKYFKEASRGKGVTGEALLATLERRLDNVIARLNLVSSRRTARILIRHGHFFINNKKMDIPSYLVKKSDIISLKPSSLPIFENSLKNITEKIFPSWINFDTTNMQAQILSLPQRSQIDVPIQEQLIVEYYSR
jgi:small subunit ribosomal protein S4